MKKASYITLIACLSIFFLQLMWIYNSYLSYKSDFIKEINNNLVLSVSKEVGNRALDLNTSNNKIFYKYASDMTQLEQEKYKGGDTVNISTNNNKRVGNTMQDVVMQIQQDIFMEKKPIDLKVLDSIFINLSGQKIKYRILLFNNDTIITGETGPDFKNDSGIINSKLVPIGTKGLQYLQIIAKVPINDYIKNMTIVLCTSVLLMIIVVTILFMQFVLIRKKEEALSIREININGTIHDLKSPLGNIITLLSWIEEDEKDTKKQKLINNTITRAQSLINDIQQILTTSKMVKNKLALNIIDINPFYLIEHVETKISTKLKAKPHSLIFKNYLGENLIQGDTLYIENILRNLIENSLKYSNDNVEIKIKMYKSTKYNVIEVSDNGWGIEKKHLKKVFRQYYQIQRDNKCTSGYGIGLSFVKLIIDLHKGKIKIESNISTGTTIKCYLPWKK